MKKNSIYALMSAIALAGSVGFSSCSSEDDVIDNPNYNPETNSVKTQFAISLGDNIVGTRMSSAKTQASGLAADFRGFQDILLIPFSSTAAADDNINGKVIALEESEATISTLTNDKNYLYNNVDVRTETDYFVFYAVAKPGSDDGFTVGRLSPSLPLANADEVNMATYGFSPVAIMGSTEYSSSQTQAENVKKNLVAKLNDVLQVSDWKTSSYPALLSLYNEFKSLRVGSSEGIQAALQDLYTKLGAIVGDGAAKAAEIKDKITADLASPNGSESTAITESEGKLSFGAGYDNYPGMIGLPNGSAYVKLTEGTGNNPDSFSAADSEILWAGANATPLNKFVYPADLRYFQQTGIKTSSSAFLANNLSSSWTDITGNATYTGTKVDGNTRSIVLVKPIQYGVGRLETSIAALEAAKYYDKDGAEVTIPTGGFTLTGVIIGGQKAVDWKFNPPTSGGEVYTIYDSAVSGVSASTTVSTINHTLALETKANEEVKIALQFTNGTATTGKAFKGKDGVILPGHTFYMVANLNPTTNGVQPTPAPTTPIDQVFIQDYVTKAIFTIAAGYAADDTAAGHFDPATGNTTGFGAALSGLPDLTTVSMEFGLSVNLEWQSGLTFNVGL